jgi:large subunit ribosomal protein L29
MKAEKIRNLTDDELNHQQRDLADQLFKLKFQMNMGQTESLKKIRGLRRDIARVQTVLREQELAAVKTETHTTETRKTEISKAQTGKTQSGKTQSGKAQTSRAEKR